MKIKKSYWDHTNKRLKKFGTALMMAGQVFGTYQVIEGNTTYALISMWAGVVGLILFNTFSDESNAA
jgi:hypothetical protein